MRNTQRDIPLPVGARERDRVVLVDRGVNIAPDHEIGDCRPPLRRAVEPLTVVVAVMSREKWAGREHHHARQHVPGGLEHGHLVFAKMADFVDQRAEPIQPEGCQWKGDELAPGA